MAKWRNYFIYTKAYFFTIGLLFILSLIDMKLVDVLFTNLISAQENKNIRRATLIVNLREGATEILKVVAVLFTNRYMKRFGGVILFNVIYIVGLVVLYVFERSKNGKTGSLIVAALLISLGKTGFVLLISFIGDQLRKPAKEKLERIQPNETPQVDEDFTSRLTLVWWVFPWGLSAIIAPFLDLSVTKSIVSLIFLLGVALGILLVGDYLVDYEHKSDVDDSAENQEPQDEGNVKKIMLKVILVWISLILYTVVAAAGTTFFLQQANNINRGFPVVTFLIFKHIANVFISVRFSKKGKNLFTHLAVGMLFSFSSSVLAFLTEEHNRGGIWWLTPQYVFLGAAEGLARDAFQGYFRDRIPRIVRTKKVKYVIEFSVGFGKFLSYVTLSLALGFSVLDADDLRSYYKLFMVASSASLLVSLYLRFNEDPILPKGLTSDMFIQSGGQGMARVPKAASAMARVPKAASHEPKSEPNHPVDIPNTYVHHG